MSIIQNYRVNSLNQVTEIASIYKCINNTPVDFMEAFTSAKSLFDVQKTLLRIMHTYGLSVSGCVIAAAEENEVVNFMGNANKKSLADYYYACLPNKDTSLTYCESNIRPKTWGTKRDHELLRSTQSSMAALVEAFQLKYSITIPVHGPDTVLCGFRFGSNQGDLKEYDLNYIVPILHTLSTYCYEAIVKALKINSSAVSLSKKQIEILTWISAGLNVSKIADKMHISENTVLYHLKKIYLELNVHNKSHAIAKAIRYNIISP